jgi:hypothetical protein
MMITLMILMIAVAVVAVLPNPPFGNKMNGNESDQVGRARSFSPRRPLGLVVVLIEKMPMFGGRTSATTKRRSRVEDNSNKAFSSCSYSNYSSRMEREKVFL